jgi:2-polyprenyl-3-methyl-5-hydroxy-6-metoxy-1,4-benzoquinol methylase
MIPWNKIQEMTDQHGYMSGVDRMSDRVKETGEVFTPTPLVIEMMQKMVENDPNAFAPGKTVIDPACGDGQFLVPVKWYKILVHNMTKENALDDIYGVDIMKDNADLCRKRLGGGHIYCDNMLDPQTKELQDLLGIGVNTLDDFFQ